MILLDVNVLVYGFRKEADEHEAYARWLADSAQHAEVGLVESAVVGFLRIVTNARIMATPAPTSAALQFVDALLSGPRVRRVAATEATWRAFADIVARDRAVRGPLVPDAWLAANAIAYGARLATADRGFARFEDLDWFVPVSD